MGSDPATRAYVERRTKEGKSKAEIIRCLKRYVAREVYPLSAYPLTCRDRYGERAEPSDPKDNHAAGQR